MCNHYRQAILKGATIPGWSIDQFSEIQIPLRFHNMMPDVYPDREGLVIRVAPPAAAGPRGSTDSLRAAHHEGRKLVVEAMRWGAAAAEGGVGVRHQCAQYGERVLEAVARWCISRRSMHPTGWLACALPRQTSRM